jgi:RNA polymerase sigma-70 factor, ECF subfamily
VTQSLALALADDAGAATAASGATAEEEVQALVALAQAGDHDAYAELYALYSPKMLRYFRYHLQGQAHLAEDLASEVVIRGWSKIDTYQRSGVPFSAWLYRIAHNRLIDHRRAQRASFVPLDQLESDTGNQPAMDERGFDQTLNRETLRAALDGLTGDQREVIVHRFLHDRPIAETARLLDKSEDAVKQLQVRALRNLKTALAA